MRRLAAVAALLAACSTWTTPREAAVASELCAPYGGWRSYRPTSLCDARLLVVCLDGRALELVNDPTPPAEAGP